MFKIKSFYLDENVDTATGAAPVEAPPAAPATPPVEAGAPAAPAPVEPAPATPPAAPVEGDWPADWRAKLSPDGKHSKTLDRFASPNAVLDSYLALRQKVDSGELKSTAPFDPKATPEEQVAWRKSHGIPEKAGDYSLKFGDGLIIGDADKPFVDGFLQAAHDSNTSPEQVNGILHWYYSTQEQTLIQQQEKDASFLTQTEDALRAEWGGEYRTNVNAIRGLVDTMPESIKDSFINARLADGTALMNHPDIARWLVSTAKTVNPVATVVPGAGANVAGAIDDEITTIEKTMRMDRKAYNNDLKMQARLRDLYDARNRAKR
jgi:hypothetical protein